MNYRINLTEAIKRFREINLVVEPVPGTSKYSVSFPDGHSTLLKENTLIELACGLRGKSPAEVFQLLQTSAL